MISLVTAVITLILSRALNRSNLLTDQPNWFAGYRTPRSLASKEAWNAI